MAVGRLLYSTSLPGNPALQPYDNLTLDKAGKLYGTAGLCGFGTGCDGVVFEVIP